MTGNVSRDGDSLLMSVKLNNLTKDDDGLKFRYKLTLRTTPGKLSHSKLHYYTLRVRGKRGATKVSGQSYIQ